MPKERVRGKQAQGGAPRSTAFQQRAEREAKKGRERGAGETRKAGEDPRGPWGKDQQVDETSWAAEVERGQRMLYLGTARFMVPLRMGSFSEVLGQRRLWRLRRGRR